MTMRHIDTVDDCWLCLGDLQKLLVHIKALQTLIGWFEKTKCANCVCVCLLACTWRMGGMCPLHNLLCASNVGIAGGIELKTPILHFSLNMLKGCFGQIENKFYGVDLNTIKSQVIMHVTNSKNIFFSQKV